MSLKVLHINWEGEIFSGGLGAHIKGLSKAQAKSGLDVSIISPSSPKVLGAISSEDYEKLKDMHIKPESIEKIGKNYTYEKDVGGKSITFYSVPIENCDLFHDYLEFNKRVFDFVSKDDFDIVHSHDWMDSIAGIRLKEEKDTPLVFTLHSSEIKRTTNPNEEIKGLEIAGGKKSDRMIAVSKATKNVCVYDMGIPEDNIRVVGNGVDPELYNPEKCRKHRKIFREKLMEMTGWDDDVGVIYHVGRPGYGEVDGIPDWKGQIPALIGLKEVVEESNLKMIMIAAQRKKEDDEKPENWPFEHGRDLLKHEKQRWDFIKENSLEEDVLFLNDYVSLLDYLSASDMAVFPSRWEDFGIVATEARASGISTIGSDYTGMADQITHGYDGLLVSPWSTSRVMGRGLRGYYLLLNRNPDLRKTFGKRGSETTMKKFTWKKIAKKVEEVYEEVLNG